MKRCLAICAVIGVVFTALDPAESEAAIDRSGFILLQVEERGEAWYVYPPTERRYYLGSPEDAFDIMKRLSLGARHDYIAQTAVFPVRLRGMILLDVDRGGEAYYIYPGNGRKYYLGRPADAFKVMGQLGQGISTAGLAPIPTAFIPPAASSRVNHPVPFVAQAPFGDWSDPRLADGCEESSVLMAVSWSRGTGLSREYAQQEIRNISDYEQGIYGEFRDNSLTDVHTWIFRGYLKFDKAAIRYNVSLNDMIAALRAGNVLIVPVAGQQLNNPYYRNPGPLHHMLVVRGYDPVKSVFITNDPGTMQGNGYEYDAERFYGAMRDYPTGSLLPVSEISKNMIVVSR